MIELTIYKVNNLNLLTNHIGNVLKLKLIMNYNLQSYKYNIVL